MKTVLLLCFKCSFNYMFSKNKKSHFFRKKLLSEKKSRCKLIGYARAIEGEIDYLKEQIFSLNNIGCNMIFSEIASLSEENKPQLKNAFDSLEKGDVFVLDKLDRAFHSKHQFVRSIHKLLSEGIYLRTLSGFFNSEESSNGVTLIFNVLNEIDKLENDILQEKKKETIYNRKNIGENLGGRPKIDVLKESLVLRLRSEGFSYRTIRSQTGVALSTIRRIIVDSESCNK